MTTDDTHKQEFRIRDLTTRSVLLFPTRAQIIRDINNITLHPGSNQIVIEGITPTIDEHSIKVEGTGSATITDVSVDSIPNRELFEDIYPSEDEEDESADDSDGTEPENEAMAAVADKIKDLNIKLLAEKETINSAAKRLDICDNFGNSVADNRPASEDFESLVRAYNNERKKVFQDHQASTNAFEEIENKIEKAEKEKIKLAKALVKAQQAIETAKSKAREKDIRKKAEIHKEKKRIKAERESFWPTNVYRITINLELSTFTPGSSRQSSVDGDTIVNLATTTFHESSNEPLKTNDINLSISYITYSASWSPRYDLSLNTVKSSGLLEYGAELKNATSETWRDAKVILSTSQTTFSGLSETIPSLDPWYVRLVKGDGNPDAGLLSKQEVNSQRLGWNQSSAATQKPREQLFGRSSNNRDEYRDAQSQSMKKKKEVTDMAVQQYMNQYTRDIPGEFGSHSAEGPERARMQALSSGVITKRMSHVGRNISSLNYGADEKYLEEDDCW